MRQFTKQRGTSKFRKCIDAGTPPEGRAAAPVRRRAAVRKRGSSVCPEGDDARKNPCLQPCAVRKTRGTSSLLCGQSLHTTKLIV